MSNLSPKQVDRLIVEVAKHQEKLARIERLRSSRKLHKATTKLRHEHERYQRALDHIVAGMTVDEASRIARLAVDGERRVTEREARNASREAASHPFKSRDRRDEAVFQTHGRANPRATR